MPFDKDITDPQDAASYRRAIEIEARALAERAERNFPVAKALADRARAKDADMQRWIKAAKGGNPNKLVGARDLHKHAFADLAAQTAKWRA